MQPRTGSNIFSYDELVKNTQEAWQHSKADARVPHEGLASVIVSDFDMNDVEMDAATKASTLTGIYLYFRHRIVNGEYGGLLGYVAPAQGGYLNKGTSFLPKLEAAINFAKLTPQEIQLALLNAKAYLLRRNPIELLRQAAREMAADNADVARQKSKMEAEFAAAEAEAAKAKQEAEAAVVDAVEAVDTVAVAVADAVTESAKKVVETLMQTVLTEKEMRAAEAKRIADEKKAADLKKIAEHTRQALKAEELQTLSKIEAKAVETLSVFTIANEINGMIKHNQAEIVAKKAALKKPQVTVQTAAEFNHLAESVNKPGKDGKSKPYTVNDLIADNLFPKIKLARKLKPSDEGTRIADLDKTIKVDWTVEGRKELLKAHEAANEARERVRQRAALLKNAKYDVKGLLREIRYTNVNKPTNVKKPSKTYNDLINEGLKALISSDGRNIAHAISEANGKELLKFIRAGLMTLIKQKKTTYEEINRLERESRVAANPQVIENETYIKPKRAKLTVKADWTEDSAAKWVPMKELANGNKVQKKVDANHNARYVKTDVANKPVHTQVSEQRLHAGEKGVTWRKVREPQPYGVVQQEIGPKVEVAKPELETSKDFAKIEKQGLLGKYTVPALNKTISDVVPKPVPAPEVEKVAKEVPEHVKAFNTSTVAKPFKVSVATNEPDVVKVKQVKVANPKDTRPMAQQITAPSRSWGSMFSSSQAKAIAAVDAKVQAARSATVKAIHDAEKADLNDRQSKVRIR